MVAAILLLIGMTFLSIFDTPFHTILGNELADTFGHCDDRQDRRITQ